MHRSNFRPRKQRSVPVRDQEQSPRPANQSIDFSEIRQEIASLGARLEPIKTGVDNLASPKRDVAVPGDIAKSLDLIHARLDRLERQQNDAANQQQRAETAFSNAILKLADKVEKISGGEDSEFSLAHSMEKLVEVLGSRKFEVTKRDQEGNMVEFEMS